MPANREVVVSTPPLEIDRRGVLKGAASLAAVAAWSVMPGRHWVAQALGAFDPYAAPVNTGPSNAAVPAIGATAAAPATPYVVPIASAWSATALLTTGNAVNGYRMVGTPDGLGAFGNGDRTITLCMNHEFAADRGAMRAHGGTGAFVSRWVIDKDTLEIVSGRDFVDAPQKLHLWTGGGWKTADRLAGDLRKLNRLCSSDLAPISAFYHAATGRGYEGRLLLCGEEAANRNARAFAFVIDNGAAYELPAFAFGRRDDRLDPSPSWENLLANPATGDATVVMALSDGGTNQVFVYLGAKRSEGSPVEKAGLVGGHIFSLRVPGVRAEDRNGNVGLVKSLRGRGDGKRIALAAPNRGTSFLRPEDGAWDPRNPNVFYFVTTDRNNFAADAVVRRGQDAAQIGRSRLWAVTFDDVNVIATDGAPTATLEMLLDGTEGGEMFDNIAVDRSGTIYICEDAGNSRHNGKIWTYEIASGAFAPISKFDPSKFGEGVDPPVPPFTDDKETSGIVDVTELFADASWYRAGSTALLTVVQAAFAYDARDPVGAELVQGGQLLLLLKTP